MNALYGIWKITVYWLNNSVVIGQIATVDHLVRLETFIRDALIQNQHLVAVFFDLQKAYDTTWKYGILNDLPIFIGNFFYQTELFKFI